MSIKSMVKNRAKRYIIGIVASTIVATGVASVTAFGSSLTDKFQTMVSKFTDNQDSTDTSTKNLESFKVKKVVDGDTIKITYEGEETSVRLIGIDTPESVHSNKERNTVWGKKASNYTKKKLKGKKVYLKFDKSKTDRYGRLLAYVYIKNSKGKKVMLNEVLVKNGYARAAYYSPNGKYRTVFEKEQKTAKKQKKGFWKAGFKKAFPTL